MGELGVAARSRVAFKRLGQAEVEDLDPAVPRDLDVRGFQVAVDDAMLVRFFETFRNLLRDGDRLV